MRSLDESRKRWQITTGHAASLDCLKKSVRVDSEDSPCVSGLRSTFLLFQSTEITTWSRALVDSRGAYTSLREHFLRFIENPDEIGSALDPLDDDQHSPWNSLRQDEEVRAEIFQDVERCMPDEPYFRRPKTQTILLDILFIFCKINQDVGYRQGMHELLAPILWVLEQDAIDYGRDGDQGQSPGEDLLLKQILDPAYIEHDAFTLLSLVMRSAKSFYELGEPDREAIIEANYSFALMLLLKYPAPAAPDGPQTFVDDAIFLRDNFSAAGGAEIISKYSGKTPSLQSSDSRPLTPLGQALSPKRNPIRTRSQLSSPARFLQQQGGVEALLQGAANRVFDRAERLGINQAVRDAVGEAKKNMQGFQASRNDSRRRTSEIMRWSLDEGRSVPNPRTAMTAIHNRNQQLARMLEQAMADLRAVSISPDGNKEKYVQAMDMAIAKVEFVKVYLEDSTMPLPEELQSDPPSPKIPIPDSPQLPPHPPTQIATPEPPALSILEAVTPSPAAKDTSDRLQSTQDTQLKSDSIPVPAPVTPTIKVQESSARLAEQTSSTRPKAPVPTRSTIAQSSFSWMLEPDDLSGSSAKSSSPNSGSPFLKSGRRPTSGPNREKAAYLFGEEGAETRPPLLQESQEVFNLGSIKGARANDG
ncbi:WD repeat domain-containing protein [Drepanopeziza brunnea f. sp. 'multigermtubi' MB_m1]|uniref:WD repeat domain-containing protein n=1 Tax=Marssonina brunnea f. sp. multigermtubi (strain MB_m1) TaxID=1072389 RepID=K1WNE2_MARBU|nr:WD repeat domain-containing protein [Drepanopeziza brunnea f. sp. 'multigermtubi' MB_m1]EKD19140.1 WD repeat domain-containing protein [Drepanopeziza brunnea f. sp. 'multigermtubi' MB_m1]